MSDPNIPSAGENNPTAGEGNRAAGEGYPSAGGVPIAASPYGKPDVSAQPTVFSTKIPSTVLLGIAIVLFLLPFFEVRCNGVPLVKVSGVQFATGFKIEMPGTNNTLGGRLQEVSADKGQGHGGSPYAIAALALSGAAFGFAFSRTKTGVTIAMGAAVLAAAALIGLMIDVRGKAAAEIGSSNDGLVMSADFTHWFYLTIIALLVGAGFSWRRLKYLG